MLIVYLWPHCLGRHLWGFSQGALGGKVFINWLDLLI